MQRSICFLQYQNLSKRREEMEDVQELKAEIERLKAQLKEETERREGLEEECDLLAEANQRLRTQQQPPLSVRLVRNDQ